jgi:hypothetical protein
LGPPVGEGRVGDRWRLHMSEGTWTAWSLAQVVQRFGGSRARWWICGGHALEQHTNDGWRTHGDVDVGILRGELPDFAALLSDSELWVAAASRLEPYVGQTLTDSAHQNNVWVREAGAWRLDIQLGGGDAHKWTYRRDPSLHRALEKAVLRSAAGLPYLAPDLQLLFKSTSIREKDTLDARRVIPVLESHERDFLVRALPPAHPWHALLDAS